MNTKNGTAGHTLASGRQHLSCYDFGRALLKDNDLDPVYVVLWEAQLPPETLKRWLLSFFCFYHAGTACWCAKPGEESDYWERMARAADSRAWPRCRERRHFRGGLAQRSVEFLRGRGVGRLFADLMSAGPAAADVSAAVAEWYGFGPWIAFKAADMLERLGIRPVAFDAASAMYKGSPTEGAALLYETEGRPALNGQAVTEWAVGRILSTLEGYKAPPRYERPLSAAECETICCKYASYRGGHYELGEDVRGLRAALLQFGRIRLAQDLIRAGAKGGLWK
jgi:hypothetical protein